VVWPRDDDPAAQDANLEAHLSVNDVSHLPVLLGPAAGGSRERPFRSPVFLNQAVSKVRIDLRTPSRGSIAPQQNAATQFAVRCQIPVSKQRLHIVAVGLNVPANERLAFNEQLVKSLGGQVPKERVGRFDQGQFALPSFDRAILYRPLLGEIDSGNVTRILDEVRQQIRQLASTNQDGYINDVILLYYQGKDWYSADQRLWLHTSRSLLYPVAVAQKFALGVNDLPTTPGARLLMLNVVNPESVKMADSLPAQRPSLLRYAWKDDRGTERLFNALAVAVDREKTIDGFIDQVRSQLLTVPELAGKPVELIAEGIRRRPFGSRR
jgi:hypothetical protein